jgi:ribonucleoside-diphosphate reductase alpha chain
LSEGYRWYNDLTHQFMTDGDSYLPAGQTIDDRVTVIGGTAEKLLGLAGFGAKFKDYVRRGWYSLATPIWTNFGTGRGLPISCYGSTCEDDTASILRMHSEVGMMTKYGGGTAGYFGNLRGRGSPIKGNGLSSGSAHFAQMFETLIGVISQGATRRGNFAGYWPVDHPDIMEVLRFRKEGSPIQDLSFGVCVTDDWMEAMVGGDEEKRRVWAKVIESRSNTGYPYVFFTDNANRGTADCYKKQGLKILHSQLCSEVMLPTSEEESFVCCLSSMNDVHFDEWKDTDAVETLVYFLDAVLTEFIRKAKKIDYMERAVRFAERHRAIGIGQLGWHSYLQSKSIPFESAEAKVENVKIAKAIKKRAYAASAAAAGHYGEPEVCKGFGRRHSCLLAVAPTKSSSFILGQVSEGIEPHRANITVKDLAKGKFTIRNAELVKVLAAKGKDTDEVWESVRKNAGSVQHLRCLSKHEKEVFKTFAEISPMEVVQQAAQRQRYIDQGQSLNLLIDPKVPAKDVNALLIEGWESGVKSFYYQIGVNAAQQLSRSILSCTSCEA